MQRYVLPGMVLMLTTQSAFSIDSCGQKEYSPAQLLNAVLVADKTTTLLNSFREDVVLISRQGTDLGNYAKSYAHVGFAVRENGTWTILHSQEKCYGRQSEVVKQHVIQFTADAAMPSTISVYRLNRKVATQLKPILLATSSQNLNSYLYSLVQYPFSTQYQSPNSWVLETIGTVLSPTPITTRGQAQAWLQAQKYQPGTMDVSWVRTQAQWPTRPYLAFDDHPAEERWSGLFSTVTENSLIAFLRTQAQVCLDANCTPSVLDAGLPK